MADSLIRIAMRDCGCCVALRPREMSSAQGELANLLIVEKEPASEAEGLHWLKAAAERGLASAHRHLGHFYRRGEHGLPVDLSQSRAHFAAAEKLEMEYL